MTLKNVTIYVAVDGTEFKTEDECRAYESETQEMANIKSTIIKIRDFCKKKDDCTDCPFWSDEYRVCGISENPIDWIIN